MVPDADGRDGVDRRTVLATGAALAGGSLAGCAFLGGTSTGATDVVVHSEAAEPVSVAVSIADAEAGDPRLETTLDLDPTERTTPTASDKLPAGGSYDVAVDVEGGPSETFEWRDVRLELAPLHVVVDGGQNVLFALQAG